jgi:hypothetical protein
VFFEILKLQGSFYQNKDQNLAFCKKFETKRRVYFKFLFKNNAIGTLKDHKINKQCNFIQVS